MRPRKTVIVITPSQSLRNLYVLQMDVWGYRVLQPATMDDAMDMVKAEQPDAVLCDRMADGMVQQLAAAAPEHTGFVLVTESNRKVQASNAILRERIRAAASRKPGPKKDSTSVAKLAISTGTHAVLALLVSLQLLLSFSSVGLLRLNQKVCNIVIRDGIDTPTVSSSLFDTDLLGYLPLLDVDEAVNQSGQFKEEDMLNRQLLGVLSSQVHLVVRRVDVDLNYLDLGHIQFSTIKVRTIPRAVSMPRAVRAERAA